MFRTYSAKVFILVAVCAQLSWQKCFATDRLNIPEITEWNANAKEYRYSIVVLAATWNPDSEAIVAKLSTQKTNLERRGVRISILFAHDLSKSMKDFCTKYLVNCQKISVMEQKLLKSNEIPTFWILDSKSLILSEKKLPKTKEWNDELVKIYTWTDF